LSPAVVGSNQVIRRPLAGQTVRAMPSPASFRTCTEARTPPTTSNGTTDLSRRRSWRFQRTRRRRLVRWLAAEARIGSPLREWTGRRRSSFALGFARAVEGAAKRPAGCRGQVPQADRLDRRRYLGGRFRAAGPGRRA